MPTTVTPPRRPSVKERRSLRPLLRPLDELARGSDYLFAAHLGYSGQLGVTAEPSAVSFRGSRGEEELSPCRSVCGSSRR